MVWSLDLDDFNKQCGDSRKPFALVSLLRDSLGDYTPEIGPSGTDTSNPSNDDDDVAGNYPADQYTDGDSDKYYEDDSDYGQMGMKFSFILCGKIWHICCEIIAVKSC